ncbi:MAG: GNAT family N-acetyltransferase [Chloroflexi bacterium]|nr:GNAT family N-acetyltransferase [Chloroflexota bacterium]
MVIEEFGLEHPQWVAYVAHLVRVDAARWVLDDVESGEPKTGCLYLGALEGEQVIGHIALFDQPIIIPATAWSGNVATPLTGPDGVQLRETFVQSFAVDEAYREQGVGRELQLAALAMTADLGCIQMRSWSSLDKRANFALKLSLGFAVHPAITETASGEKVCGAYFIKTV